MQVRADPGLAGRGDRHGYPNTYLLHSTIAGNLRYARPDATQDEIEAAARAANIHDRSLSFAQGYDPPMLAEELA